MVTGYAFVDQFIEVVNEKLMWIASMYRFLLDIPFWVYGSTFLGLIVFGWLSLSVLKQLYQNWKKIAASSFFIGMFVGTILSAVDDIKGYFHANESRFNSVSNA